MALRLNRCKINNNNINIVWDFQDFFYRNRVYITKNSNLITNNIQTIIISIEELVWTETKIIY